jgi:DegV family protein with EDD domain
MGVRVVTDSASDLSPAEATSLGVTVVPLSVRFGDAVLADVAGPDRAAFGVQLAEGRLHPQTASPSPGAFAEAFRAHQPDDVVCITMPAALSGTHDAARVAARLVGSEGGSVHVMDGRCVSRGLATVVRRAATAAADGATASEVMDTARHAAETVRIFAVLDDLEHLARGGRIRPSAARVGTMLSVKPILGLRQGQLEVVARPRTRTRALHWLLAKVRADLANGSTVGDLTVMHAWAPDVAEVTSMVENEAGQPVTVCEVGAVIASHSGPGMLGLSWLPHPATVTSL